MNIELKAQTSDNDLIFVYTGRQLIRPLKSLIRWLTAEIKDLQRQVDRAKELKDDRPPPKVGSLPEQPPHVKLEGKLRALCVERDDALLWKQECDRDSSAVYRLTMLQLKRLYRYQLDPRSEVK